jgi:hypothetical protein
MNPTELKDLIGACVQALSDTRTDAGLYPVAFNFGTTAEIFIDNIREDKVEALEDGGTIHMEFVRFAAIAVDEVTSSQAYSVKLVFSKTHSADSSSAENLTLITEMYNLKQDLLKVLRGDVTTNLSAANKALAMKMAVSETEWAPFDYAPNVTAGITCSLIFNTKFCRQ